MKIGKNGRRLSAFQEAPFLRSLRKFRKYQNMPKGEKHHGSKLIAGQIYIIRHPEVMTRAMAKEYASKYGISPGYIYHIRARRRWKHL